ncbi:FUSC family protein [Oerskovia sp. M15]
MLLTTFSILQASWGNTLTKARNKVIGLVAGSLTVAVVLLVVPSRYLTLVAVVALCLGLWYIVTRPALGAAFMVVVSVGFNSVTRDLNAVNLLVQYVGLTLSAVLVGLVLGFAVIPGFRPHLCDDVSRPRPKPPRPRSVPRREGPVHSSPRRSPCSGTPYACRTSWCPTATSSTTGSSPSSTRCATGCAT